MLGIIGAMRQEIDAFIEEMQDVKEISYSSLLFYKGKISGKDVVVVESGIGKVAAARTTSILLEHFDVSEVINIGIAGGNNVPEQSIILASKVAYSDAYIMFNNVASRYGQMAGCPLYFESDKNIVNKLKEIEENVIIGDILSSDKFIDDYKMVKPVLKHFYDANVLAFDMESAAIAQVCYLSKIPFAVLRYISDNVKSKRKQLKNYFTNKALSSYRLVSIIIDYLK